MRARRRVLLFAYYFPPANAIGAIRSFNLAKWLGRLGWEVTVVTPVTDVWRNSDNAPATSRVVAREGIRCIRTDHHWRFLSPGHLASPDSWTWSVIGGVSRRVARLSGLEVESGWMREAERACAGLEPSDVDVILATGTPFGSFDLARRLGRRLGRPFVLDYRDLWTANPHAIAEAKRRTIRIEEELLAESAAITAVSPGIAAVLQSKCPNGKRVRVVTNGYDPEEMQAVEPNAFGHFAIVYAGIFYPPKRVIGPVMAALRRLEDRHPELPDWAFHYYGWDIERVRQSADRYGLAHKVVLHGFQPRAVVLAAVKAAGVSVVISSVEATGSAGDRGIVTGKVFDAIGLGTPTLVVAPSGSDLEGVIATAGRGIRVTGAETDRIVSFLGDAMRGRSPAAVRPATYSWSNLAGEVDEVLTEVSSAGPRTRRTISSIAP